MTFVSNKERSDDGARGAINDATARSAAVAGDDERPAEPDEAAGNGDDAGKPTIDEPTGPALDPSPDEFDKQAEEA